MKILVFTSLFPNSLSVDHGIFIKNRMHAFSQLKNCEIKVVAPVPYCPPFHWLGNWYQYSQVKQKEILDGIEIYHPRYLLVPRISMQVHGFLMFLSAYRLIKRIKKEFHFDIIDAHYIYPDAFAGVLIAKVLKKPVVISARGSDINQFSAFKSIKPMIQYTLKHSSHIISVCSALKDAMLKLGAKKNKVSVIPNGIDGNKFFAVNTSKVRNTLKLNLKTKIILSVGSLISRKGHHIIIEAMRNIVPILPEVKLYIAGEGEFRNTLEQQIQLYGLQNHVALLGHVPNDKLNFWYSAADVFCLASSREGWANVIMESMACGTPVVATNVWGAPEIITTDDVGILVERNSQSLEKGLLTALGRQWDPETITAHVSKSTWSKVAIEVNEVFRKVME